MHEADEPDLVCDLLDTHVLAGEYGAEMDLLASKADPATLCDGDRLVMERIVEFLQAVIEPAGTAVDLRRVRSKGFEAWQLISPGTAYRAQTALEEKWCR